jgi:hypothetical protein
VSTSIARRILAAGAAALTALALTATTAEAKPVSPTGQTFTQRVGAALAHAPADAPAGADIPATCGLTFGRVNDQVIYQRWQFNNNALKKVMQTNLTGWVPRAVTSTAHGVVASYSSGALWFFAYDANGGLTSRLLAVSGWGGVRSLSYGSASGKIYALFDSGAVAAYTERPDGSLRTAGVVAASGWNGVRELSPAPPTYFNGAMNDYFYALTASGGMNNYLIDPTLTPRSFPLFTRGWSGIKHLSAGGCQGSPSIPLAGITPTGDVYAYFDSNGYDANASDIRSEGKKGWGFTGLLFD